MIEAILLALALCVDTLVVSTTSAFSSKMSYRSGFLMAGIFALFQGGFPFLGALLGGAFQEWMSAIDHWVAFGLLLLVGGKMILDALRGAPKESQMDVSVGHSHLHRCLCCRYRIGFKQQFPPCDAECHCYWTGDLCHSCSRCFPWEKGCPRSGTHSFCFGGNGADRVGVLHPLGASVGRLDPY